MDNNFNLPPGTILDSQVASYRIVKCLGQGGMGFTYLATTRVRYGNVNATINVAIKEHFIKDFCERDADLSVVYSNPTADLFLSMKNNFISEAQRLQQLGNISPNIVTVNEVFEANSTAYYVMEYISGQSLQNYVDARTCLSEDETICLMSPIIAAVANLHANNTTHLDIKPANIMLSFDHGDAPHPVLIDFGLSKNYDDSGNPLSTIKARGTSDGYAPIEQYGYIETFTPQCDVYSLGATMLMCLTGKHPQSALTFDVDATVDSLNCSAPMREFLRRSLQPRYSQRFANASEMYTALSALPFTQVNDWAQPPTSINTITPNQMVGSPIVSGPTADNLPKKNPIVESQRPVRKKGVSGVVIFTVAALIASAAIVLLVSYNSHGRRPLTSESTAQSVKSPSNTEHTSTAQEEPAKEATPEVSTPPVEEEEKTSEVYSAPQLCSMAENCFKAGDYASAVNYFRQASDMGYLQATYRLAQCYHYGNGVSQNQSVSTQLFRQAAEAGHADAQASLGICYYYGQGVPKDIDAAKTWWYMAAEQGNQRAIKFLNENE